MGLLGGGGKHPTSKIKTMFGTMGVYVQKV